MQRNHRPKTIHFVTSALIALASFGTQGTISQVAHAAAISAPAVYRPVVTRPWVLAPAGPLAISYPGCGSIQTCIDNAVVGDTINVAAGTYTESFTLNKAVSLVGQGAGATFVALSGQRVLTVTDATITQATRIEKLTFSGGNPASDIGGGIYIDNGTPFLVNVVVADNTATNGGGIYARDELHVSGLIVRNNNAVGFAGIGLGGGIFASSRAMITGAYVISNAATGNGAGMYLDNGSNSIIESSRFEQNKTPAEGGGLYITTSNAVLLFNNRFFDNSGEVSGGGAYFESSRVNMDNNIFAFNYGKTITDGVELGLGAGPSPSIVHGRHNTFANARNSTSNMRAIELGKDIADTVFLTNTVIDKYNIAIKVLTFTSDVKLNGVLWSSIGQLWAGANVTYSNAITGLAAFANANGRDFRISPTSSNNTNMIDRGIPSGLLTDIEEFHRPHGFGFDLGADEINRKPVATYDAVFNVTVGSVVTITPSGAGVFDPDGDPIIFSWQQLSGLPVTISDPFSTTFGFTAPMTPTTSSTDPQFQITITDTAAGGEVILKRVRVKISLNETPISALVAGNDSPKYVTETVTLTSTIGAGSNVTYTWEFGDGSANATTGISPSSLVTHTYPTTGTFTAVVTATNSVSVITATTQVSIINTPTPEPTRRYIYIPLARN